jgi:RNA polymerase sigma factor (sigma-70 family)
MLNGYGFPDNGLEDDITQRVFMAFRKTIKNFRFETEDSLKTWLFGIARNEIRNEAKAKRPTVSLDNNEKVFDENVMSELKKAILAYQPNFNNQIQAEEIKSMLIEATDKINSPYKEAMRAWIASNCESSMEELAIMFGTNEGTIKSRFGRAGLFFAPLVEKLGKYIK